MFRGNQTETNVRFKQSFATKDTEYCKDDRVISWEFSVSSRNITSSASQRNTTMMNTLNHCGLPGSPTMSGNSLLASYGRGYFPSTSSPCPQALQTGAYFSTHHQTQARPAFGIHDLLGLGSPLAQHYGNLMMNSLLPSSASSLTSSSKIVDQFVTAPQCQQQQQQLFPNLQHQQQPNLHQMQLTQHQQQQQLLMETANEGSSSALPPPSSWRATAHIFPSSCSPRDVYGGADYRQFAALHGDRLARSSCGKNSLYNSVKLLIIIIIQITVVG